MVTRLSKWGNSQGIRIPRELLKEVDFRPDEDLNLSVGNGRIIIEKKHRHKTLRERAEGYGGKLGLGEEVDWGSPVGREVW